MADQRKAAREDQFLGALLGLAIGDALGRPLIGKTAEAIAAGAGSLTSYQAVEGAEPQTPAGEITDKTEIVLCIVESMTTNEGHVDAVNINARLGFLAAGPSREFMSPATLEGIVRASESDGLVSSDDDGAVEFAVACRGVPAGLLHAVGGNDDDALERDAVALTRLTHGGRAQAELTIRMARAVRDAARGTARSEGATEDRLGATLDDAVQAGTFVEGMSVTLAAGGDTSAAGAITGAVLGARLGASGIPQSLIDGLDARIYLTLAAPWFYRTAVRRAGTVIDLRHIP